MTEGSFLFDLEMDLLGVFKFKVWFGVLVDFKKGFKVLAALRSEFCVAYLKEVMTAFCINVKTCLFVCL